ncbi:GIY-YIG nuclease family protein [Microcoleus sp. FACHB-672]|uniref:GIY-YIG nuclease family protein n=1 Tax=Microcoleus sp. FACHB-672 TaxID=2692825 RepID=UPI001682D9A5|nr:GIY-YIG nuclease family protein [Microcoleus sp. FACHB-672]MBD2042172.1 GIY-YIG nuclease family protein [Microcoleus sp. FACHB-672]
MEETVHDNFFKNFIVVTATLSSADSLPVDAGIYALYHAFDFSENELSEQIDARIKQTVFKTKFSEEDNRSKFIVNTCGESVGLSEKMEVFIKAVSEPKERRMLKKLLISSSILQRPDYIGTASNLRERFVQHLERDDGFFSKYASLRHKDEFLFVCLPCPINISRELESLLIQLCQPKFNTQRS